MIEQRLQRIKESDQQRKAAIDEINFTYRGLHTLLPMLVRRMAPPMIGVLEAQVLEDRSIRMALRRAAVHHGQMPRPCACEDASHLLSEVQHMERATNGRERVYAVLAALLAVRTFLLHTWKRLIEHLPEEEVPAFRKEAIALQNREAEQHRELLALERRLVDGQPRAGSPFSGTNPPPALG